MSPGPLIVEATRGDRVESRHEVDAVVVDAGGVVASWGDPDRPVLPRSAIKPLQAVPLVESGAADAWSLSDAELALACSSHDAEPAHVAAVEAWLARLGFDHRDLRCGAHPPGNAAAAAALARGGHEPTAVHNNCSGKHAGFLTLMAHSGLDPVGYLEPGHALHRDHLTPALAELCGFDPDGQVPGIDGCGIPVWTMPLRGLGAGWVGLAARPAGRRLLDAMVAEPFHVAGTVRACTRLITAAAGRAVVKTGAEGVFCGVMPGRGLGLAVKVRDGAARASAVAMGWLLGRLEAVDGDGREDLVNHAGRVVGTLAVADDLTDRQIP